MAKIPSLPSQGVIDSLKGLLDFYMLHMNPSEEAGICCVRSWPRYRPEAYSEASKVMQPYFSYINKMSQFISEEVRKAYADMASGTNLTWKDMMVRCYLNKELL